MGELLGMRDIIVQLTNEPVSHHINYDAILVDDSFIGEVADYVDEDTNFEEELNAFLFELKDFPVSYDSKNGTLTFHKGFIEEYFQERFIDFRKEINKLLEEDGMKYFLDSSLIFKLESLISNKFNTYVYDDYGSIINIDHFIRNLKVNDKYYIGGIVTYHY